MGTKPSACEHPAFQPRGERLMPVWEFRPQQFRATVKDPATNRYVSVAKVLGLARSESTWRTARAAERARAVGGGAGGGARGPGGGGGAGSSGWRGRGGSPPPPPPPPPPHPPRR